MAFNEKIVYLENSDFDESGHFKHDTSKPVAIMIFGNGCIHCAHAKPEYNKFAQKNSDDVIVSVIATDGPEADKALVSRLSKFIPDLQGIPTFVLYRNGRYIKTHSGARTAAAFEKFVNSS